MELIDHLSEKLWERADTVPDGFFTYSVIRNQPLGNGKFRYAVQKVNEDTNEGGEMIMVTLEGAAGKRDPLLNVRNCSFRVDGENVNGVDIDGDCVLRKS